MITRKTFLGLPDLAVNILSFGGGVFLILAGFKILNSSDVSLKVANSQLITSTSADRLSKLADELDAQAELIKQKDIAYQRLSEIYQQSLQGKEGYGRLQQAIETVGELPKVQELESVQSELTSTKEDLLLVNP